MAAKQSFTENFVVLKFADSELPVFKEVKGKKYVQFGERNDYPDYILLLSNKSAKHNAIINGKVNYIYGNGLQSASKNEALSTWIGKCNNAFESLNEIAIKIIKDNEVFGGFYLNIIPDVLGRIAEIYHIDFKSIRTNETRDKFFYKKDWADRKEQPKEYPKYNKGIRMSSILSFNEYRQGADVYPLPNYISAINYIEADFEVSKQTLSNAKTGFSASKLVNFNNGEPGEEQKKEITKRFNNKFGGSDGAKTIISFNNDPAKAPTVLDLGTSDLTKEDFSAVDNLITSNIYAGHQITSPMLFGIMESGKLGAGNELKFAYDIFKNTYVNFKQRQVETVLNYLGVIAFGMSDLKLQDVDPIGIPFSDQTIVQVAPLAWIWEKLGIDPAKYPNALPAIPPTKTATPQPITANPEDSINVEQSTPVNENIKNLSGRQHQQMLRIIKQFHQGKLTQQQATTLLKASLGLTDADVNSLLGLDAESMADEKFGKEYTEEEVAELFETIGAKKEQFEIIKTRKAKFNEEEEFTFNEQFDAVSKTQETTATDAAGNVITTVKKTGLPEVAIKYSYEVEPGVGASIIPGTRPFCRKLIELDRLYTRTEIQMISEQVGYSVWLRRGGFWNKGHGDISPSCRHQWKSHIVIKKS
jgi:hypothetical protein